MGRSPDELAVELGRLTAGDFDLDRPDARGMERLQLLLDELPAAAGPERAAELILAFIERVTADDLRPPRYDFGTPGPLVHTLESLPGYQAPLEISLRRRPAPLSVWMLNRILNATEDWRERERLLSLLREAGAHPTAAPYTRELAEYFYRGQQERS